MSDFQTPKDLLDAYSNGLPGSHFDQDQTDKILSELPMPLFGDAAPDLSGSAKGKLSLPFMSVLHFDPNAYEERQTTGDCVSMGTRNAVDVSRAVQIHINGSAEDWVTRGATEAIYGSRGYGGQGMAGVTAAQFVHSKGGVVLRKKYGDIDLSVYDSSKGTRWGTRGIPREIIEEAIKNQVGTISLCRSLEEAADALANGYGLAVCSNQGFSNIRDKDGFSRPQGSWSHCFPPETVVSGPQYKFIKDVKVGDIVYGHTGDRCKVTTVFERHYEGKIYNIFTTKGKLTLTEEHPVAVADFNYGTLFLNNVAIKWCKAKDLKEGDYVFYELSTTDNVSITNCWNGLVDCKPILSIKHEHFDNKVYNLEVEKVNTYIANKIVVHNCMAWTACDYRESEPAFVVQQSWGYNWNSGPTGDWQMPKGSFKIHADVAARMISYGSCWAFSNVKGFPRQNLPDYGSSAYL